MCSRLSNLNICGYFKVIKDKNTIAQMRRKVYFGEENSVYIFFLSDTKSFYTKTNDLKCIGW